MQFFPAMFVSLPPISFFNRSPTLVLPHHADPLALILFLLMYPVTDGSHVRIQWGTKRFPCCNRFNFDCRRNIVHPFHWQGIYCCHLCRCSYVHMNILWKIDIIVHTLVYNGRWWTKPHLCLRPSLFPALGQIMLYVDGMNGLISDNEAVQWLYTLVGSKVKIMNIQHSRLVCALTTLK